MVYCMAGIHGNAAAYFDMKRAIMFDENDKLYILGNIFDGNDEHPEYCLAILEDIMNNKNITLILGEHECAYKKYFTAKNDEAKEELRNLILSLKPSGKALLEYLENMDEAERNAYLLYLGECNISGMVKINKRKFYMVSGAPIYVDIFCYEDDWDFKVALEQIEYGKDYKKSIESDPLMYGKKEKWDNERDILISGNKVREVAGFGLRANEKSGKNNVFRKIEFYKNKMLIDCGGDGEKIPTLACVGVKEEEFVAFYKVV